MRVQACYPSSAVLQKVLQWAGVHFLEVHSTEVRFLEAHSSEVHSSAVDRYVVVLKAAAKRLQQELPQGALPAACPAVVAQPRCSQLRQNHASHAQA